MNTTPLISVVTITWNAAGVIAPTLASLRAQTCSDFEHVVIDGASSDATLELVRRDGVPGARILSEPDRGLYDAMNKGLHLARGRYVVFLNAGDAFFAPDTLERYARAARTGADIIYSDTVIVDSDGRITAPRHLSVPERLTAGSFARGMLICHQAFMVRRDIAPDYDLTYKLSADYDWTIRCIRSADPDRCINLHCVGIRYLSDGLTDRRAMESLKERFRVMAKHYGTLTAVARHISFIPRLLRRRLAGRR